MRRFGGSLPSRIFLPSLFELLTQLPGALSRFEKIAAAKQNVLLSRSANRLKRESSPLIRQNLVVKILAQRSERHPQCTEIVMGTRLFLTNTRSPW